MSGLYATGGNEPGKAPCPNCGMPVFQSASQWRYHLGWCPGVEREWATVGNIECRCGDVFPSVRDFHEHIHLSHPDD